jgi:hypothetical protein
MTEAARARYLAAADRLLAEGDIVSARIILGVVHYDDLYRKEPDE